MKTSYIATIVEVLQSKGPLEPFALASLARKLNPLKKADHLLINDIFRSIKQGEHGLRIVEYPFYQRRSSIPRKLPRGRYVRCALDALAASPRPLSLDQLAARYRQRYKSSPAAAEFWMYVMLGNEGKRLIVQEGQLRIGLKPVQKTAKVGTRSRSGRPPGESAEIEPIHEKMYEENLESLLIERLEEIEPGLTLVSRQYVTPVGRLDLLCRDRKGNLVVVELKRFRASTESIIDQVTRYMGWVQKHVAKPHEAVRAFIVVGRLDTNLQYSVGAIPNLSVKCLRVSLSDPE